MSSPGDPAEQVGADEGEEAEGDTEGTRTQVTVGGHRDPDAKQAKPGGSKSKSKYDEENSHLGVRSARKGERVSPFGP